MIHRGQPTPYVCEWHTKESARLAEVVASGDVRTAQHAELVAKLRVRSTLVRTITAATARLNDLDREIEALVS